MDSPTAFLRSSTLIFLAALALIVTYQLLTGRINARRMLLAKGRAAVGPSTRRWTGELSPSRIQLLVVTIGFSIYLLAKVVRDPGEFIEIPTGLLLLMTGSGTIYLARKANNLMPFPGLLHSIRRMLRRSRNP